MHWRRWPILYRLLLVNALVVAAGASAGTLLTKALVEQSAFTLAVLFTVGGVLLSIAANYAILRAALRPLSELTDTVDRVRSGSTHLRADLDDQDPDLARLTAALNTMLDRLSLHTATIEAHREQLRALSAQVITAQEDERKRIARELHDETSQSLASLIIALERIEAIIPEELAEARRRLASTRELAHDTLAGLRGLVVDLRPMVLDDLGLVSAIRWYAVSHLEREGVDTSFVAEEIPRLPSRVETALFRIAQEAVNNVVKHADATQVTIRLNLEPAEPAQIKHLTLSIEDDGHGFEVDRFGQSGDDPLSRLGLFGIQERVAALGGQVTIESAPGKGTRLHVQIPLDGLENPS
jgi:two-component system sensor histidine kinase UhpB